MPVTTKGVCEAGKSAAILNVFYVMFVGDRTSKSESPVQCGCFMIRP